MGGSIWSSHPLTRNARFYNGKNSQADPVLLLLPHWLTVDKLIKREKNHCDKLAKLCKKPLNPAKKTYIIKYIKDGSFLIFFLPCQVKGFTDRQGERFKHGLSKNPIVGEILEGNFLDLVDRGKIQLV